MSDSSSNENDFTNTLNDIVPKINPRMFVSGW